MPLPLTVLLQLATPAAPAPTISDPRTSPGWASLVIAEPGLNSSEKMTFGMFGSGTGQDGPAYWIRRDFNGQGRHPSYWADSRSCPGLGDVVKELAGLPPTALRVPTTPTTTPSEPVIVAIGPHYTLEIESDRGAASGSRFVIETDEGTPLGDWADKTRDALSECWKATPPVGTS
jgi:hypothetical protein